MWDIIGHNKQICFLEKDVEKRTVKHAYLFAGPEKIGKFTLARRFSKILQCPEGGCNACAVCRQIEQGIHPDTVLMRDDGESIKVDAIRALVERTNKTFQSPYFAVCIESIERMTTESANALLKTLEEPARGIIFLLTTNNRSALLPTILSRVFLMELGGVPTAELTDHLKKTFPDASSELIQDAVGLSLNKPGLAIDILQNSDLMRLSKQRYLLARRILNDFGLVQRLQYVEETVALFKNDAVGFRQEIKSVFEFMIYMLRAAFFTSVKPQASHFGLVKNRNDAMLLVEKIQYTYQLLTANINKKLVLENLMLSF